MDEIKNKASYFESFRDNHRKMIKNINNNQLMDQKRRQIVLKLEAQFMEIPHEIKLSQLYKLSLDNNKLAYQINKIIPVIQENWTKGNKQNMFLIILGNILCDGLNYQDIYLISSVVRKHIQPDYSDSKFIKHGSFFFSRIFKWHIDMTCQNQQDDQILNQKIFLPILKSLLFSPSCDQISQTNLLKSIQYIFKAQQSQIQTSHRIKRNIELVNTILDYHKLIIQQNRNQKQEQLCLEIYYLAVQGCIQAYQFLDNQQLMNVFEVYLNEKNKKALNIVIQIFQNVYSNEFNIKYSIINDFINQKFLRFILKQQPKYWITLTYNISQNAHDLLFPFIKQIISEICQICKQSNTDITILQTALLILRQFIYLQRQEKIEIDFFKSFSQINGFRIIQSIQSKNNNVNLSIEDILLYQSTCIDQQTNQPFERNPFLNYD